MKKAFIALFACLLLFGSVNKAQASNIYNGILTDDLSLEYDGSTDNYTSYNDEWLGAFLIQGENGFHHANPYLKFDLISMQEIINSNYLISSLKLQMFGVNFFENQLPWNDDVWHDLYYVSDNSWTEITGLSGDDFEPENYITTGVMGSDGWMTWDIDLEDNLQGINSSIMNGVVSFGIFSGSVFEWEDANGFASKEYGQDYAARLILETASVPVPEPSSMILGAISFAAMGLRKRFKKEIV